MKENVSLLLNGVLLCHVVLKVGGEEVEGGDVTSHVDSKQLEQREDVFMMGLAVDEETLD